LWTRKSVGCSCSWKNNSNIIEHHEHDPSKDNRHETNLTQHAGHHKHQLNCACCVKVLNSINSTVFHFTFQNIEDRIAEFEFN
jgi:hypothetical protein